MKIVPGIHRIGDNSMINAYLIGQAGEVTIIDAGVSGFYKDINRELAAMGRTPADVRALVLTHGHTDHIGFAERLRRERGVPVSVHEADAALARGEVPNPAKGYGPVKLGPLLGFLWFSALHGGLRTPKPLLILAGDASSYVTGQTPHGGRRLGLPLAASSKVGGRESGPSPVQPGAGAVRQARTALPGAR